MIRDTRNLEIPVHTMDLDVSAGILVPLYDPETKMMFLAGKGDRYIQFVEIADQAPWIIPGLRYTGDQVTLTNQRLIIDQSQGKGACLVPKRALNVMKGEINRLLQLADNSIVPIMWQVCDQSNKSKLTNHCRCRGRAMTGSTLISSLTPGVPWPVLDLSSGGVETTHPPAPSAWILPRKVKYQLTFLLLSPRELSLNP